MSAADGSDSGRTSDTGEVNQAVTGRGPVTGRLDDTFNGHLVDRAHTTPPYELPGMLLEELTGAGARDVAVWLHDYGQRWLHPVGAGMDPPAESIDGTLAGRAFTMHATVEQEEAGGARRLWAPMLDGTERVGVLALTLDHVDDGVRDFVRRLAGNVAHLFFTKSLYTDDFDRVRRRRDMTLAAEMQWDLLPPLAISTPVVSIAGLLEPAYSIAGDSFDYAMNADALHFAIFDAMGHGLASAIMASTAIATYRHARRSGVPLTEMYASIDAVLADQFGEDTFATALFATLDVGSGVLQWINAGHPPPLLVRGHRAVRFLSAEPHLPVGLGGGMAPVARQQLEPGDSLLFFTDGVIEHRNDAGEMFGEERLAEWFVRHVSERLPTAEVLRRLNRDLLEMTGEDGPSDDATLVLLEWTGRP